MSSEQNQGYELVKGFEEKQEVSEEDLPLVGDYIYYNLNCGYRVKKFCGYCGYYTKCKIVLRWKKARGLDPKTKLGEALWR